MKREAFLTPGLLGILVLLVAACGGPGATATPTSSPPTPTPTSEAATATPTPPTPSDGGTAQGQQVFTRAGCGACHTIEGVPGATGQVGPPLTNIGTVAATRKPDLSAEEYIRESIEQPQAFVVEGFAAGVMPQLRGTMSDEEFDALVAFLMARQ